MRPLRLLLGIALCSLGFATTKPVDFSREVRPILSDKCFHCHGPDAGGRKADLRLDVKDGVFGDRTGGPVVVPGKPTESKLVQRVTHEKKAMRMPPAYSGLTLTQAEIDTLQRWIAEGAKWETHWAYTPPKRVDPPPVKLTAWPKTAVDRFILARLEREGLKPSPPAPREILIRRVTLDLTGLPPAPAEIDAFLKDKSPDAYAKVVDRLLASPHYGERMTQFWLDLARYADTHGYHIDSGRDMWPWRDWVIGAFNTNLPFNQFIQWQIAGDLLPDATREQKIASGLQRNHMINFEGGAIPEEYQAEYLADRVETTGTVFLGTTIGCAKCHDHKYDPIQQKDFYRLAAFYNTIPEKGLDGQTGNAAPFLPLPDAAQEARQNELKAALSERAAALPADDVAVMQFLWQKQQFDVMPQSPRDGLRAWYELDGNFTDISGNFRNGRLMRGEIEYSDGPANRAAQFNGEDYVRFPSAALEVGKPFTIAFWVRFGRNQGMPLLQQLVSKDGKLSGFELALGKPKTLPQLKRGQFLEIRYFNAGAETLVRSRERLLQGDFQHLTLSSDGSGKASGMKLFVNGEEMPLVAEQEAAGAWSLTGVPVEIGGAQHGRVFSGAMDDLRFYAKPLNQIEAAELAIHYPAQVLLARPGRKTGASASQLRDYYLTYAAPAGWRETYAGWKQLRKEQRLLEASIPTVMVMEEMEKPRDTYLLGRGDYQNKVEKVTPGVPSMLPPLPAGAKADRLALANWLIDPSNPLTARVAVNRFWQVLFGHGIVKTSEDFGSQGEPPVHPELLDWLADEFVRTGWDVKQLQRLLVTSAAYQQSSKTTPALTEKDPENRLLARGPRVRLPAETVRDNALAVSGLLAREIGGPSVLPYQPPGLWEELAFGENFTAQEYEQGHGDDLYRRSMYTFWKRTVPPASMSTFDAPDREKCTSRRAVTNTPLQALVTLNDPTYIEAARKLAERAYAEAPASDDARLAYAFRLATARAPNSREMNVLRASLAHQKLAYAKDAQGAARLLSIGESKSASPLDPATHAAWTNVCTILLNLDETITKE